MCIQQPAMDLRRLRSGRDSSPGLREPHRVLSSSGQLAAKVILLEQNPVSGKPQKLAGAARDPMIASSSNGEGPVVACWESKLNGDPVVLAARIEMVK